MGRSEGIKAVERGTKGVIGKYQRGNYKVPKG